MQAGVDLVLLTGEKREDGIKRQIQLPMKLSRGGYGPSREQCRQLAQHNLSERESCEEHHHEQHPDGCQQEGLDH